MKTRYVQAEVLLARFFHAISEGERQIEIRRIILSEQFHFEPYSVFHYLDINRFQYLSIYSLYTFMQ